MKAEGDVQGVMPVWVQPVILTHWPTRVIASDELYYEVPVKKSWQPAAGPKETTWVREHVFRGDFITDWLLIALLDTQGAAGELANWVEGPLSLVKFPNPTILQALSTTPRLLTWEPWGPCPPLRDRLDVDEAILYTGLARFDPADHGTLGRLYVLLARRGRLAWSVTLSLMSACFPGMPEAMVEANDHVRAGATFGHLKLRRARGPNPTQG